MKRKTSKTPTRLYVFGAKLDGDAANIVRDHVSSANEYYNVLIGIERDRRFAYREARSGLGLDRVADTWRQTEEFLNEARKIAAE